MMESRYKHKMSIEFEVESSDKEMPLNSEIASALFQKRHEENLTDQVERLDVEEVVQSRRFNFDPPIEFGGHKKAFGVTLKLPIYDYTPVSMQLHFYNDGTEKEYHQAIKRRVFTKGKVKSKGIRHMQFRHQNAEFPLVVDENDVVERQKFTFKE